jgi:hypothetical protein
MQSVLFSDSVPARILVFVDALVFGITWPVAVLFGALSRREMCTRAIHSRLVLDAIVTTTERVSAVDDAQISLGDLTTMPD